jgi:hypothetical protein
MTPAPRKPDAAPDRVAYEGYVDSAPYVRDGVGRLHPRHDVVLPPVDRDPQIEPAAKPTWEDASYVAIEALICRVTAVLRRLFRVPRPHQPSTQLPVQRIPLSSLALMGALTKIDAVPRQFYVGGCLQFVREWIPETESRALEFLGLYRNYVPHTPATCRSVKRLVALVNSYWARIPQGRPSIPFPEHCLHH